MDGSPLGRPGQKRSTSFTPRASRGSTISGESKTKRAPCSMTSSPRSESPHGLLRAGLRYEQRECWPHLNAGPTSAHDVAVKDVAAAVLVKLDAQRRCQSIYARFAPKRPSRENARHLKAERAGRQAACHDVEAFVLFAGAVRNEAVQPHVAQDTCDYEATRARGVFRFIHGDSTCHWSKHAPSERRADERTSEHACGDGGARPQPPRRRVIDGEKVRHQPRAEAKPHPLQTTSSPTAPPHLYPA